MTGNTDASDDAEQERLRGERLAAESERQRELDREQRAVYTWAGPGDDGPPPELWPDGGEDEEDDEETPDTADLVADADEFEALDPTDLSLAENVQVLLRRLPGDVERFEGTVVETGEYPHVADDDTTLRLAPAGSVYRLPDDEDDPFEELIGSDWTVFAEVEDDEDEWNPQPASLREGETTDISAHTQANLETINRAAEEGYMDEEDAEAARKRILSDEEGA